MVITEKDEWHEFTTVVERVRDFEFRVQFDKEHYEGLTIDEPEPMGQDAGPNASRVLSAAIGNCLSASLLFCLQRSKQKVEKLRTEITTRIIRNAEGRWRISNIRVQLHVSTQERDTKQLKRCIDIFENYCVVTESVRQGIPIDVTIIPEE